MLEDIEIFAEEVYQEYVARPRLTKVHPQLEEEESFLEGIFEEEESKGDKQEEEEDNLEWAEPKEFPFKRCSSLGGLNPPENTEHSLSKSQK